MKINLKFYILFILFYFFIFSINASKCKTSNPNVLSPISFAKIIDDEKKMVRELLSFYPKDMVVLFLNETKDLKNKPYLLSVIEEARKKKNNSHNFKSFNTISVGELMLATRSFLFFKDTTKLPNIDEFEQYFFEKIKYLQGVLSKNKIRLNEFGNNWDEVSLVDLSIRLFPPDNTGLKYQIAINNNGKSFYYHKNSPYVLIAAGAGKYFRIVDKRLIDSYKQTGRYELNGKIYQGPYLNKDLKPLGNHDETIIKAKNKKTGEAYDKIVRKSISKKEYNRRTHFIIPSTDSIKTIERPIRDLFPFEDKDNIGIMRAMMEFIDRDIIKKLKVTFGKSVVSRFMPGIIDEKSEFIWNVDRSKDTITLYVSGMLSDFLDIYFSKKEFFINEVEYIKSLLPGIKRETAISLLLAIKNPKDSMKIKIKKLNQIILSEFGIRVNKDTLKNAIKTLNKNFERPDPIDSFSFIYFSKLERDKST